MTDATLPEPKPPLGTRLMTSQLVPPVLAGLALTALYLGFSAKRDVFAGLLCFAIITAFSSKVLDSLANIKKLWPLKAAWVGLLAIVTAAVGQDHRNRAAAEAAVQREPADASVIHSLQFACPAMPPGKTRHEATDPNNPSRVIMMIDCNGIPPLPPAPR